MGYYGKKSMVDKAERWFCRLNQFCSLNRGLSTCCTKLPPNLFFVNAEMNQSDILKALSTVEDPDLKRDLVSLNMVRDLKIAPDKVSFTVVLTTPACPLKEKIRQDCEEAVRQVVGDNVEIDISMTSSVTTLRNNAPLLPKVKNIIAVASGKGGVGKSTVTTN